jgi:hypothetical protein
MTEVRFAKVSHLRYIIFDAHILFCSHTCYYECTHTILNAHTLFCSHTYYFERTHTILLAPAAAAAAAAAAGDATSTATVAVHVALTGAAADAAATTLFVLIVGDDDVLASIILRPVLSAHFLPLVHAPFEGCPFLRRFPARDGQSCPAAPKGDTLATASKRADYGAAAHHQSTGTRIRRHISF